MVHIKANWDPPLNMVLGDNPFLSEFSSGVRQRIFSRGWGVRLAILTVFCTVVIGVIGHYGRADFQRITFVAKAIDSTGKDNPLALESFEFGYLVEMSHAFFYLLLAPVFFVISERFLGNVWDAVWNTSHATDERPIRLKGNDDGQIIGGLSTANRRYFRFLLPGFAAMLVGFGVLNEASSYINNSRRAVDLGYIQVPFIRQWQTNFNYSVAVEDNLIPGPTRTGVERSLRIFLANTPAGMASNWDSVIDVPGLLKATSGQKREALKTGAFQINLKAALARRILSIQAGSVSPGFESSRKRLHGIFGILLVIFEGLFHAFLVWILLKIGLWISLVYRWLPLSADQAERFELDFADGQCKYGLPELYKTYNDITLLLIIGSIGLTLNYFSNSEKNTWAFQSGNLFAFWGQVLIVLIVAAGLAMLVFGPMYLFHRRLRSLTGIQVKKLAMERRKCSELQSERESEECRQTQDDRMQRALAQRPWPAKDPYFKKLVVLTLVFLIFPIVSKVTYFEKLGVDKYINALLVAKRGVLAVVKSAYLLD